MANKIIETFEFSTTFSAAHYGHNFSYFGDGTSIVAGRFGNGLQMTGGGTPSATVSLGTPVTVIAGAAFKIAAAVNTRLFQFVDGVGGTVHGIVYRLAGTNRIQVYRGDGITLLGESADGVLIDNAWGYVECKYTVSDTVGIAVVKVNGAEVLNLTGQDTKNSANAYCGTVNLMANTSVVADDFYVNDTTGSINNDFRGDCKGIERVPDEAGNYTQWTPSAGSNYQNVDEAVPDVDATYNESGTLNNKDSYGCAALAITGAVVAVQVRAQLRKTDAGGRDARIGIRVNGVDYWGSTIALSDSYVTYSVSHETNPNTGIAWLVSEVDGAEPLVEVMS